MDHLATLLNLQVRSRRNALHASRLLQARRAELQEVEGALRGPSAPAPVAERPMSRR